MPVVHSFEKVGKVRYVMANQPQELVYLNVQRIMRDLEATLRPVITWQVLYRLPDGAQTAACAEAHARFAEELSKKLHGKVTVKPTILRKVVDDTAKAAEGGCIIA